MYRNLTVLFLLAMMANPSLAYDPSKAEHYQRLFAPMAEADTPKALARIPAERLADWIKQGEEVILLDVRTPAEQRILGVGNPNTLAIPLHEVFTPERLASIPTDKKVVVVCQVGVRSVMVGVALRDIGFTNVQALQGGLAALISYLNAKTAYEAPKEEPKR